MKFSITIPAYKSFSFKEAIRSVISQTYTDWELIIVDDCSPEDLASIVKPFLSDKRIHYYRNDKNCGAENVVDNWNICLSHCAGDYVLCMGDDDRLLPCCLEEFVKLINTYPDLNIYHARLQVIDTNGQVTSIQEERPAYETCKEMLLRQWTVGGKQFLGDFLFSRQWLNAHGGYVKFPYGLTSDRATANLAAKDKGIANAKELMFEYRDSPMTISRSQNLRTAILACNDAYYWYVDHFPDMLLSELRQYYVTKLSQLIYLDVRQKPKTEAAYWLLHQRGLIIPWQQKQKACIKGMAAAIKDLLRTQKP